MTANNPTGNDRAENPAATGAETPVGALPGASGEPVFTISAGAGCPAGGGGGGALPVLLAVPHAGRCYPAALRAAMRWPDIAGLRLEDRHADTLGRAVAARSGAMLMVAHAPRAMIDLNRAPDEIDAAMLTGPGVPGGAIVPGPAGRRVRSGLGLVPRRLAGMGEIWSGPLPRAELARRITAVHGPWHARIAQELAAIRDGWGAALLIDLHSMPPLPPETFGRPAPRAVIGDRFGAACAADLANQAAAALAATGAQVMRNRPYAGGYTLERHGRPADGVHAVQIEVDRAAYLDPDLREPGPGLADLADLLAGMVRALAAATAALGAAGGDPAGGARPATLAAE